MCMGEHIRPTVSCSWVMQAASPTSINEVSIRYRGRISRILGTGPDVCLRLRTVSGSTGMRALSY
jgi:hypothetical protein